MPTTLPCWTLQKRRKEAERRATSSNRGRHPRVYDPKMPRSGSDCFPKQRAAVPRLWVSSPFPLGWLSTFMKQRDLSVSRLPRPGPDRCLCQVSLNRVSRCMRPRAAQLQRLASRSQQTRAVRPESLRANVAQARDTTRASEGTASLGVLPIPRLTGKLRVLPTCSRS